MSGKKKQKQKTDKQQQIVHRNSSTIMILRYNTSDKGKNPGIGPGV